MSNSYTRWYRVGTVKVVNGSKSLVGTNTYWADAGLNPGDIYTDDGTSFYEVDEITDSNHITLRENYKGLSSDAKQYSIIRNFSATMPAEIAAKTAQLLGDFRHYVDTDMQSIRGKSAYEIAVTHGFAGTEEQWLEALKADHEWQILDTRTQILTPAWSEYSNGINRNFQYRGKCLGTKPTQAQYDAIYNGTFDDMYLGDYWSGESANVAGNNEDYSGVNWTIVHFNYWAKTDNWMIEYIPDSSAINKAQGGSEYTVPNHVAVIPMAANPKKAPSMGKVARAYPDTSLSWQDRTKQFHYTAFTKNGGSAQTMDYWIYRWSQKALIPTFGPTVAVREYTDHYTGNVAYACSHALLFNLGYDTLTSDGYVSAHTTGWYGRLFPLYWVQVHGTTMPSTDGKIHWLPPTWLRQFAYFKVAPWRPSPYDTVHDYRLYYDITGPNSSGVPTTPMVQITDTAGGWSASLRTQYVPVTYSNDYTMPWMYTCITGYKG